jgi:serine/threonine-protein kinase
MSESNSDRNLLFGLLALQNDFISREQLVAAVSVWLQDKSQSLDVILRKSQTLPEDEHALLSALVKKHLERHGNDAEQSLAAVGSVDAAVRDELALLGDAAIESSLACLGLTVEDGSPYESTVTFTPSLGGRFRILRPHARGGLGQVSVALDRELNREIALKEIQGKHADNAAMRARFVREAEITGGLEHPGVVPVYSLGQHDNGQPFYAMRFIRGDNLRDAVQQFHKHNDVTSRPSFASVEFRKLLGRFLDVCNAVEYAHSRGVLHRDLKPRNVMIGKYGETLVVDWGLAKVVGRTDAGTPVEEPTLHPSSDASSVETAMGETVGTPAYMSPEQAAGRLDELQPASDVYSLGATLYYLLTGKPSIQTDNMAAALEKVHKGDFPPPRQLAAGVPVALEAVCLKAMARNPQDRYPHAVDLANDLELWLADEPVSACREPVVVRLGRTFRKHRTAAAAILAVLLTSTIGLTVFSSFIAAKNSDLEIARMEADDNRKVAVREQKRAVENLATARATALNVLEIAEQNLSAVPGKEGFRETMMDRCYAMFNKIHNQAPHDPSVHQEFVKVARLSGNVKRLMQKHDEARRRLLRSIELQEKLLETGSNQVAQRDYFIGTLRDLGTLEKAAGDLAAADKALGRAATLIDKLLARSTRDASLQRTHATIDLELVSLRIDLLNIEEALASATRCAATCQKLIDGGQANAVDPVILMLAVGRRGQLLDRLQRRKEAARVLDEGIRNGRKWLKGNSDRNRRYAFGRMLLRSAEGLAKESLAPPESAKQIDEALAIFASLVKGFPKTAGYQYYLGDCWRVRGLVHQRLGEPIPASAAFEKSREILEKTVAATKRASYRDKLSQTYADWGRLQQAQGDRSAAKKSWETAVKHARLASRSQPANLDFQQRLKTYESALAGL